jgi:hypothetical protein
MEQTEKKEKTARQKMTKPQIAMLAMAFAALVLIMAFSCYGCSYQPVTPPDTEEALDVFGNLYATTWDLDTAAGTPELEELGNDTVSQISFGTTLNDKGQLPVTLELGKSPTLSTLMAFREGYGFYLLVHGQELPVKITYSQSKDEKTETVTFIGTECNEHLYFLRETAQ